MKAPTPPSTHTVMTFSVGARGALLPATSSAPPAGSAGCVASGIGTSLGMVNVKAGDPSVQLTSVVLRHGFAAWVRLYLVSRSIPNLPAFVKSWSNLIVYVAEGRLVMERRYGRPSPSRYWELLDMMSVFAHFGCAFVGVVPQGSLRCERSM